MGDGHDTVEADVVMESAKAVQYTDRSQFLGLTFHAA